MNAHNGKALDVYQNIEFEGQNVIFWDKHNGLNQKWRVVYADKAPNVPKPGDHIPEWGYRYNKDFYIVSALPSNRYLTAIAEGSNLVIKVSNGQSAQKWYFDYKRRAIVSRWNGQVIVQSGNNLRFNSFGSVGRNVHLANHKYDGTFIRNVRDNRVFDVYGGKDLEAGNVIPYKKHGGINQKWRIIYTDQVKKGPTKGLNKEFGFYINREFVLMPEANQNVYAQYHGSYLRALSYHNPPHKAQRFFFDQVSKMVLSAQHKTYAVEIQSNGNGTWASFRHNARSRWW